MSWEIVAATGEWAGAAAVVVTLFYLARQIRVTRDQLSREIDSEIDALAFSAYDPIYEGRNAEIMFTGLNQPEVLSGPDGFVFDLLMHRHARVMGKISERKTAGQLTPALLQAYSEHYDQVLLCRPGAQQWFRTHPAYQDALETFGLLHYIEESQ